MPSKTVNKFSWADVDSLIVDAAQKHTDLPIDAVAGIGSGGDYLARLLASILGVDVATSDGEYGLLVLVGASQDAVLSILSDASKYSAENTVPLFLTTRGKMPENSILNVGEAGATFPWENTTPAPVTIQ